MIQPADNPPGRVLIVKPSSLGDVVTALPVLRGLKRSFPGVHVSWLLRGDCASLLAGDPDLDEVIVFERKLLGRSWRSPRGLAALLALRRLLRRRRFDWAIDLQGLFRSGYFTAVTRAPVRAGFLDARESASIFYNRKISVGAEHTVRRNIELARLLGVDARRTDMSLQVPASGLHFARAFCREHGLQHGRFLVLAPPARWRSKRLPVRHWRRIAAGLAGHVAVVVIGAPGEEEICRAVAKDLGSGVTDLAGRTSVGQMVGLIAASGGVVCNDSAAKFIAPAVGVGVVTLIGPTRVERTGPLAGRAIVADTPCQGCLKRKCRHTVCMELIRPADVIEAAEQMLDERSN